jgi:hypothetical protein
MVVLVVFRLSGMEFILNLVACRDDLVAILSSNLLVGVSVIAMKAMMADLKIFIPVFSDVHHQAAATFK